MCKYQSKATNKVKSCTELNHVFFFLASCHLCLFQVCFLLCAIKAVILFVCHTYKVSESALVLDLGVWAKFTEDTTSVPVPLGSGTGLTELEKLKQMYFEVGMIALAPHPSLG